MYLNIRKRIKYELRKLKTRDLYRICDILDIDLKYSILPTNIKGLYHRVLKQKYVKISCKLPDFEARTVLAHEIGHAILHRHVTRFYDDSNTFFNQDRYELEANILAAELLVPDDAKSKYEGYTIEQIAAELHTTPYFVFLKFNK